MAASDIRAHIETEDALLDRSVYSTDWPHAEPDDPFSPDEAHRAMQRHAGCPLNSCARKRAARETLIAAGHFVPDPRNGRMDIG